MRTARQETLSDTVAEMRNGGHTGDASCLEWVGAVLRSYAGRLDAAAEHALASVRCGCYKYCPGCGAEMKGGVYVK